MKQNTIPIDNIIAKFLSGTASDDEEDRLVDWLAEDDEHLHELLAVTRAVNAVDKAEVDSKPGTGQSIDTIMAKFLSGTASDDEEDRLVDWLAEDDEHIHELLATTRAVNAVEKNTKTANLDITLKETTALSKTESPKKKRLSIFHKNSDRVDSFSEREHNNAAESGSFTGKFNGWDVAAIIIILAIVTLILFLFLH